MATYSVKIGEIDLTSDRPITDADRERATRRLAAYGDGNNNVLVLSLDEGEVVLRIHQYKR